MASTASKQEPDAISLAAFNQAVAEHSDGLKGFASRLLNDRVGGEDVAQDALLALYRHLHQVPPAAYRPWLYRVARNLCLDILRRRRFKLRLFRDVQRDDDSRPIAMVDRGTGTPLEMAESEEARSAIETAVQALPEKFREAFVLCELEGMSYEDAAVVLQCPVKTVSTRLFRARQRFRSLVSQQVDF